MLSPMFTSIANTFVIDVAAVAFIALLVDGIVGDMAWLFSKIGHPIALLGRVIGFLERRLNREGSSERARFLSGLVVTLFVVFLTTYIGWYLSELARAVKLGWIVEVVVVTILLAQRSLYEHVLSVARALGRGDIADGRVAVQHIVGRDTNELDKNGIARAAIESLAENFADGVVAPIFWYLVVGLPGVFAYKAINTLDSMIGYRSLEFASFGLVAARLDDVANWIPSRLAALILVVSAVFPYTADPSRAAGIMWRDSSKHPSPNAGWPEGAMAGALNLSLGGPRQYPGGVSEADWIGDGTHLASFKDIHRALLLFIVACLLNGLVVFSFAVLPIT